MTANAGDGVDERRLTQSRIPDCRPDCWLFDLDNVLYPAGSGLFDQVVKRMTDYVAHRFSIDREEAATLRRQLFVDHGTTLNGLMTRHAVDPHEFLRFVHDVDMSCLPHDAALARQIAALPGRRIIFTNADADYAARILKRRGLDGLFDAIHDIHDSEYRPKPAQSAYQRIIDAHAIDPQRALFIEDMPDNLKPAKMLGMQTAWIVTGNDWAGGVPDKRPAHVDYIGHSLEEVLRNFTR